jgi:hypothetical protein
MAKDTAKAFKGMLQKEAAGTKNAGKPIGKSPKKGKK